MSGGLHRAIYALLLAFLFATTASAHEGPPFPLFVDQNVGPYVVSVWTDPDVGTALFFVMVSAREPAQLPADLKVQIGVQPASGRSPETFYSGERENVQGNIQYKAEVHLKTQELWRVRVRLDSAAGTAETTATVEATPPGYGRWDLLLYLLPFVAVGILWVIAMVHKIKRRTGDNHA
jgi:hypothetical protein